MNLAPAVSYAKRIGSSVERLLDICVTPAGARHLAAAHRNNGSWDVKIVTVNEAGDVMECDICFMEEADLLVANVPNGHPDADLLVCPTCRHLRGLVAR